MKRYIHSKTTKRVLFALLTLLYLSSLLLPLPVHGFQVGLFRLTFLIIYIVFALIFYQVTLYQKELQKTTTTLKHLKDQTNPTNIPLQLYDDTKILYYDFKYMFPPYHTYGLNKITHSIKSFEVFVSLALSKDDKIILYGDTIYVIYIPHTTNSKTQLRIEEKIQDFNKNNDDCPLSYQHKTLQTKQEIQSLLSMIDA